jgi:hypothetical protein
MNCVTSNLFAEPINTSALLRPAKRLRRQADDMLREIAFVLELTRQVRDEIVAETDNSTELYVEP